MNHAISHRTRRLLTLIVVLSALVGLTGLRPVAAHAATVTGVTLTGPTTVTTGQSYTYSGTLTAAGAVGVPQQTVTITVDGVSAATATSGTQGAYSAAVTFHSYGSHVVKASALSSLPPLTATSTPLTVTATPTANPPDRPTDIGDSTTWIYTGPDAPQTGVSPGTITADRVDVIRGSVTDRSGQPVAGVTVSIVGHSEYGSTATRGDGGFDLAVNGGQPLTVHYAKSGLLPVDRTVSPQWRDYTYVEPVVMIAADTTVTTINSGASSPQVARGSVQTDGDGSRQATVLFPAGTHATMTLPNGNQQSLGQLHMRATEYTVGSTGTAAMPATLPTTSAYTYAVDYTVDEASAAQATTVSFDQPVPTYTDNFLHIPVGTQVPAGYYDTGRHAWIPARNGLVIGIVSISGGQANIDLDGDGTADSTAHLTDAGITDAERSSLAQLYTAGTSLWRVPVTHFTPWDYNYGYGLPDGATAPDQHTNGAPTGGCNTGGSIVGCSAQTLGEAVPVTGTPFTLHYDSSRVPGNASQRILDIGITGANPPATLKSVSLQISVAGQSFTRSFSGAPNQRYAFTWDGNDAYGRPVNGSATATVRIGYTYQAVYYAPTANGGNGGGVIAFSRSFEQAGGAPITADRTRNEISVWQTYSTPVGTLGTSAQQAIGGWTLDVHNAYDPTSHTLYLGDGTTRRVSPLGSPLALAAGNGNAGSGAGTYTGDHAAATAAGLSRAGGVAVTANGALLIADTDNGVIRKGAANGTITTIAGGGNPADGVGDGGPATAANLDDPVSVAVGPDQAIYIADAGAGRIRQITPNGTISTVAGGGHPADGIGDTGPATAAALLDPESVAIAPDGTVYVSDTGHNLIRHVTADGLINTVAGGGSPASGVGDGLPGPQASLDHPLGIAVDRDGQVYIADASHDRVRRLGTDGLISTVAGQGDAGVFDDGKPATSVHLTHPTNVALSPLDGTVLITQRLENVIRTVDTAGVIKTLAGTGVAGYANDGAVAAATKLDHPTAAAVAPDGKVYIADAGNYRIRDIVAPFPGASFSDIFVPSADGSEVYQFSAAGRQIRTIDAMTTKSLYTFGYNTAGQLQTVTDHYGNTTTVGYDGSGVPTGIDSPYGQHTTLHTNNAGYLDTITDPATQQVTMSYGGGGLLSDYTDARNNTSHFDYDSVGRLSKDTGPDGHSVTLDRSSGDTSLSVTATSARGKQTTYATTALGTGGVKLTTTYPSGIASSITSNPDGTQTAASPDGSSATATFTADPQWGMAAPDLTKLVEALPSGATTTMTAAHAVTLSDPANPLSVTHETNTTTLAGRTATSVYDKPAGTLTSTSPAGRQTVTTLNADSDVSRYQAGTLAAVNYSYDGHGRLNTVTAGSGANARATTIDYGNDGYLSAVHDPLHTVTFHNDAVGRPTSADLPGGDSLGLAYDANGNVTGVTPPGQPAHHYTYTSGNQTKDYQAPQIASENNTSTTTYNNDRQPTTVSLPDGRTLTNDYDSAGRLDAVAFSRGSLGFSYSPSSGLLTSVTAPGGQGDSFGYDGPQLTSVTSTGPAGATVSYGYDNSERVSSVKVGNQPTATYSYDADDNPIGVTGETIGYDPANGQLSDTTAGVVTTSSDYNTFGEPASEKAKVNGTATFTDDYTRDPLGRVSEATETIAGNTATTDYGYDARGRLTDVTQGGSTVDHYSYDANGNRTGATTPAGTVTASYDNQDRLTRYGSTTYTYNADGQLSSATTGSAITSYGYDELGLLTSVDKPDGTHIAYLYDGEGRRTGKKINGSLVEGFVYGAGPQILATTGGNGTITATFSYAAEAMTPDLMTTGGHTYRILTDSLGSPRLVVDTASGNVTEHVDYDPFGNVTTDTNPGFLPFGFAGGLADTDTGLVRFGARDYDPATGRFTAKDPTSFGGGDTNLYAYAGGDPVNNIDPTGLFWHPSFDGFLSTVYKYDPLTPVVESYKAEIHAVESGCSYLQSIKYGLEGTAQAGLFVATFEIGGGGGFLDEAAVDAGETGARDAAESCLLPNSFTGDTPITLADGKQEPIVDVKVGDKVLATDPETGRTQAKPVAALIRHSGPHTMVQLTLDDGSTIDATDHHPFWDASDDAFIDAIDLRPGEEVLSDTGTTHAIATSRTYQANLTAYNLEIAGIHTYYAGTTPILVHNSCAGPSESPVFKQMESFRGKTRTNGLTGSDRQYYEWDYTHNNIEVYNRRGVHVAVMHPETGEIIGGPVPGRTIDL